MVLSCFSNFFEKMFTMEMKEKYPKSISIESVEATLLKNLIDFIYTGTICINTDNVCSLLAAADYLQIEVVKEFCFDYLDSAITSENCFLILKIAEQYQSDHLTEAVKQLISETFDVVACSNDFRNFSKVELVDFLPMPDRSKVKETSIYKAVIGWTKHDEETREEEFPEVLKKVKLHRLPSVFLQDVVLSEKLIIESLACSNLVMHGFSKHTKELFGTKVLSLGGKFSPSKVTEVFNCFNDPPQQYPDLPEGRWNGCSESHGDSVYFVGGISMKNQTSKAMWLLKLDEDHLKWKVHGSGMQKCSGEVNSTDYNRTIIVNGRGSSECFFEATVTWNPFPLNLYRENLVSCKDSLFSIHGLRMEDYRYDTSGIHKFDSANKSWKAVGKLLTSRGRMAAVGLNNFIYVIGGKACVMQGRIYVVGGVNAEDEVVREIECYDPSTDEWSVVGTTEDKLVGHSLVVV